METVVTWPLYAPSRLGNRSTNMAEMSAEIVSSWQIEDKLAAIILNFVAY